VRDSTLSIIVAVGDDVRVGWFEALLREAADVHADVLLVGDVQRDAETYQRQGASAGVTVSVVYAAAGTLVPVLWGRGLDTAGGAMVALTSSEYTVAVGWARALMAGLSAGYAGVGGRLALAPQPSRLARALFYLRYAAFLAAPDESLREVHDIAADNAAYRADTLRRYAEHYEDGFWEVETHHRMRADGARFALVPGMSVKFGGAPHVGSVMRQRFAHGRHFSAWRVRAGGRRAWQVVLAAPLVPFVLLGRSIAASRTAGHGVWPVLATAWPFLLFAGAWAAGEAAGAIEA
jgi:hypothetical protein